MCVRVPERVRHVALTMPSFTGRKDKINPPRGHGTKELVPGGDHLFCSYVYNQWAETDLTIVVLRELHSVQDMKRARDISRPVGGSDGQSGDRNRLQSRRHGRYQGKVTAGYFTILPASKGGITRL